MADTLKELFTANHIRVYKEAVTQEKIFQDVSEVLVAEGYARPDYCSRLLEREKEYPTGLKLGACSAAIPHISNDEVLKSTIYVSRLAVPCPWHSMENTEEIIPVSLVFNICLAEKEKQVEVLSEIIALFQNEDLMKRLLACDDSVKLYEEIRKEVER